MQDLPRQSELRGNAVRLWLRRMITHHYQLQFPGPSWQIDRAVKAEIYQSTTIGRCSLWLKRVYPP
jgi:hypothetical protein